MGQVDGLISPRGGESVSRAPSLGQGESAGRFTVVEGQSLGNPIPSPSLPKIGPESPLDCFMYQS